MLYGLMVTYMRPHVALDTLERIERQTRTLDEIVIIDNGIEHPLPEVEYTVLRMEENLGPAGAIAVGIDHILKRANDDDWIVLIDDDDPPATCNLIERLMLFAESVSAPSLGGVGGVGARLDLARSRLIRVADEELDSREIAVDYFGGGQYPIYRVAALRRSGVPSAELFFGFDDLELGLRLRAAGFHLVSSGQIHKELRVIAGSLGVDPSESRRRLSEPSWRTYYGCRNFLVILRTFGGRLPAIRYTCLMLGKPAFNLFQDWRLALRVMRITSRALFDGWTRRMGRRIEPSLGCRSTG